MLYYPVFVVATLLCAAVVLLAGMAQVAAIVALLFLGSLAWMIRKFQRGNEFGLEDHQMRGEREALRFLVRRR